MTPPITPHDHTERGGSTRWRAAAVLVLLLAGLLVPLLGPSLALDGTGEGTGPGSDAVTFLRTVMFGALCVHVGELFVALLVRRLPAAGRVAGSLEPRKPKEPEGSEPGNGAVRPASWATGASLVGLVAAFGLALIVSTGNLVTLNLADMDIGGLYGTRDGTLALIEVNGFLLAALCASSRRPALAVLPLFAVIVAEALRAHPEVYSPLFGSALTLAHLSCAALWTGGLLHVLRTLAAWRRTDRAGGTALLGMYARIALVLFGVLTVTGILSTVRRLPLDDLLTTAYGRVLVAKLLLVLVAVVLALLARRRLRGASDPRAALVPARAEVLVLLLVVAFSALLTAMPLPVFYQAAFWWTWF